MPDKDKIPDAVRALMERTDEMITAADLAPVVHMHSSVIIKYAKDGTWPREICNYVISGDRVKFFRLDFLRKAGYLAEPEPEEITDNKLMAAIVEGLEALLKTQKMMLQLMDEQNDLLHALCNVPRNQK